MMSIVYMPERDYPNSYPLFTYGRYSTPIRRLQHSHGPIAWYQNSPVNGVIRLVDVVSGYSTWYVEKMVRGTNFLIITIEAKRGEFHRDAGREKPVSAMMIRIIISCSPRIRVFLWSTSNLPLALVCFTVEAELSEVIDSKLIIKEARLHDM